MKNKKKISVMNIISSLSVGGREKVVIDMLNGLNDDIFTLSLCCLKKAGPILDYLKNSNMELFFLNKKDGIDFGIIFKLTKILMMQKPDIVHTHNPGAFIYGSIAAKLANIPVIVNTEHGYGNVISLKKKMVEYYLIKHTSKTIAVSDDLKKKISDGSEWCQDKIITIHNGIDCEKFKSYKEIRKIRESFNFKENDIIVGNVARLSEVKDHRTLIDAFSIVCSKFNNSKLVIVGDGELRKELENKASCNELKGRVYFLGERKDINDILSMLDIFVLSSISEGISISLLEAMASGKAIIATNVGGNPEVVIDGKTGILVPSSNPILMANAIERLISDRNFSLQICEAAKKHVNEKFSIKVMVKHIENLYENLLLKNN